MHEGVASASQGMLHTCHTATRVCYAADARRGTHTLLSFMKSSGLSVRMLSLDHMMTSASVTCACTTTITMLWASASIDVV